jgi:hypothetical protein
MFFQGLRFIAIQMSGSLAAQGKVRKFLKRCQSNIHIS